MLFQTPKKKKGEDESSLDATPAKKEAKKKIEKPSKGRIRISLNEVSSPMKGKKGGKRKRSTEVTKVGSHDGSIEANDAKIAKTGNKRQRKSSLDGKLKSGQSSKQTSTDESALFDLVALKKRRESLDGSFKKARKNLSQLGPWTLPARIEDKFRDVAIATLSKMNR